MRGVLAEHLKSFIKQINIAIADAEAQGIVPTPELARERLAGLSAFVTDSPDIAFTASRSLLSEQTEIPVKIYSPKPQMSLPVLVFFHGGGHMCGDTELYDPMCRKMALAANCVVISVEYRLTPEHRYPAGLEDAEYVLRHYSEVLQGVKFNDRLIIAGDSAGGAICASMSMKQAQGIDLGIKQQILIYPSVDYTMSYPSVDSNGKGYFLEKPRIKWYFDHYFNEGDNRKAISPLFGTMNTNTPATMIIIAGCDPLRDEAIAYAERLNEHDVKVVTHQFDGMIHAFMNIEDIVPDECQQLYRHMADFITE